MELLSSRLYDFLTKIPKSLYIPIGVGVAGVIFLGIGLIQLTHSSQNAQQDSASTPQSQASASASLPIFHMQIDVSGAVVHPGVYALPQDARVQDALIAAGGMSSTADRGLVARQINLAAKLTDGAKIYIPHVGEIAAAGNSTGQSVLGTQVSQININTATESELDNLPGIGHTTAQKIISLRPFSSINDLLTKKAVTKSTFDKIKSLVSVY